YDFGSGVTTILGLDHPDSVIGIHLTTLESDIAPVVDDAELSDVERFYLARNRAWSKTERGYSAIQSTKPQTVGYGLNDSPAGLAAYLGEKWYSWSEVTPPDDRSEERRVGKGGAEDGRMHTTKADLMDFLLHG